MKHLSGEEARAGGGFRGRLLSGRTAKVLTSLVALLVVAAIGVTLVRDSSSTDVTAYFSTGTGLYKGDDVKVLGVKVGKVTSVEAQGDQVKVTLSVDSSNPVPVDAKAAIVAPSLVSGRFVQLAPAWKSGPKLQDGAVISNDRTAVPVSFDEVKREITDLSEALGPKAGGSGSLSDAIKTIDANLAQGNDEQLRSSIAGLRTAAQALSDRRSDLFQTISNLNSFTRNLATNDAAVQGFTLRLDRVTTYLDANRDDLGATIDELARLTSSLSGFVRHHRDEITTSVARAGELSGTLARQADDIAAILHVAPHAIDNLYNAVDHGAITGRLALANLDSVASLVCGALLSVGAGETACQTALGPLLQSLGLNAVPGSAAAKQLEPDEGGVTGPSAGSPARGLADLLGSLGDTSNSQGAGGTGADLLGLLGLGGTK